MSVNHLRHLQGTVRGRQLGARLLPPAVLVSAVAFSTYAVSTGLTILAIIGGAALTTAVALAIAWLFGTPRIKALLWEHLPTVPNWLGVHPPSDVAGLLGSPAPSAVFVEAVSATVDDGVASEFTLAVANEGVGRATNVNVTVTIDHDGSGVAQNRTVTVPGEGKADVFVDATYPAKPTLTVRGIVIHDGRSDPFCYKYMAGGGPQFVLCDDDTSRHFRLRAEAGHIKISGTAAALVVKRSPPDTEAPTAPVEPGPAKDDEGRTVELGIHLEDLNGEGWVTLDGGVFSISRYPVTNRQYRRFLLAIGKPMPRGWTGGQVLRGNESHPVYVSWSDAGVYCTWLTKKVGEGVVSLPTEAQWDVASRSAKGRQYAWNPDEPLLSACRGSGHSDYQNDLIGFRVVWSAAGGRS